MLLDSFILLQKKNTMSRIETLNTFKCEYNADSVEWCPHEPFQYFFVCAYYQLSNEGTENQKRLGNILLFSVTTNSLKLQQSLKTAAVLDQKWCPNQINGFSVLAIANAENALEIYRLNSNSLMLEPITSYKIHSDRETLMLSLDWSSGKYSNEEPYIICSDSMGNCHQFSYCNGNLLLINSFHCHEYEAWITAYYYWDTTIFFTGGDDNLLLKFDLKTSTEPVLKNKVHGAGVTSIHSNTEREFVLATGSYDEYLRLWDIRNMKMPLESLKMPGPVWRIKWDPTCRSRLLAACMLGGVHVVKVNDCNQLEIVASYNEHKSMAYGADWCHALDSNIIEHNCDRIIGTCSFYDNLLCISKFIS